MQDAMKVVFTVIIAFAVFLVIVSIMIALGYVQIGEGGWAVGLLSTLSAIGNLLGI